MVIDVNTCQKDSKSWWPASTGSEIEIGTLHRCSAHKFQRFSFHLWTHLSRLPFLHLTHSLKSCSLLFWTFKIVLFHRQRQTYNRQGEVRSNRRLWRLLRTLGICQALLLSQSNTCCQREFCLGLIHLKSPSHKDSQIISRSFSGGMSLQHKILSWI